MKSRQCELCDAAAAVFCPSDAAFLCRTCDVRVHEANFLVARHVRRSICSDADYQPRREICPSCSTDSDGDASSDCISSTTSPSAKESSGDRCFDSRSGGSRRVDYSKAEGVFLDWCGKLGVGGEVVVRTACRGLRACSESWTGLPFRVCLAASMWFGLRLGGERISATWQVLRRLEELSGVPAKVVLAAALKLERGYRGGRRRRRELEEGWAEC